jgi:hypothetical protein
MSKFFQDVKTAVTGKNFTTNFIERPLRSAIWYHYRLALVVAALFTLAMGIYLLPGAFQFSLTNFVADYYPNNLVVTIDNGAVSTNVTEPYGLPQDGTAAGTLSVEDVSKNDMGTPTHILVIDTNAAEPLSAMERYDTAALLTKDQILIRDDGEIRVFKLTDVTLTISEEEVISWAEIVSPIAIVFVLVLAILFPFLMAAGLLIGTLFVALFYALIVLLIGRTHDLPLGYKKSYMLTLYLLTIPTMLTLVDNYIPYSGWIGIILFVALAVVFIRPVQPSIKPQTDSGAEGITTENTDSSTS